MCFRVAPGVLALAVVMCYGLARGQRIEGVQGGFRLAEPYGPPHQNQMKFLLAGAEARAQGSSVYLVAQMKLQTFRTNGEPEIVIEAPECVYDSAKRLAGSAGRLRVETGDGRFFVEGEGFLWRQTNSSLIISNEVHTIIRQQVQKTEPSKP